RAASGGGNDGGRRRSSRAVRGARRYHRRGHRSIGGAHRIAGERGAVHRGCGRRRRRGDRHRGDRRRREDRVSAIGAMLAAGVPPFGLGYYAREAIEPRPAWRFVAVNAWRSDARELVAQARERGAAAWLYGTPEHFRPDTFRDGLA